MTIIALPALSTVGYGAGANGEKAVVVLHLLLNRCLCDYRCVFCSMGSAAHIAQSKRILAGFDYAAEWQKVERVLHEGQKNPLIDGLHIMGNDPCNYPDLARVIRRAKELGFARLVLETIGMRLSDPTFAHELVDAGVDCFKVPIYGASATVHDAIVRLPGAHQRLQRALANVAELDVELKLHTLILRQNLYELPELHERYDISFRYPFCHGAADLPYGDYAPRLSDVSPEILRWSDVSIPCITGPHKTNPRNEVRVRPEEPDKEDVDSSIDRRKRPAGCTAQSCGDYTVCEGIYEDYYAVHGEDEFEYRPGWTGNRPLPTAKRAVVPTPPCTAHEDPARQESLDRLLLPEQNPPQDAALNVNDGADERPIHDDASQSLVIRARGMELTVVLADYWPGRPCFHSAGDFAFFIPTQAPEGTCSAGEVNRVLLASFTRLFDRVVQQHVPTDLTQLHELLYSTASVPVPPDNPVSDRRPEPTGSEVSTINNNSNQT